MDSAKTVTMTCMVPFSQGTLQTPAQECGVAVVRGVESRRVA